MQGSTSFVEQLRLVPTVPSFNPRYDRTLVGKQPRSFSISTQAFLEKDLPDIKQSSELLAGFKELIHPEGDTYLFDQSRRIITPSNTTVSSWGRTMDAVFQKIVRLLGKGTKLPLSSELYLSSQGGPLEVAYYLADHDKKVIYWLEETDAQSLGLGPFESDADLRGALTSEYWVHVDYFPNHRGLDAQAEEDLMGTLRHGCIDDMTAPGSTFPWSAEECRHFLSVLEGFRMSNSEVVLAERTSCIARLWAAISRVRHIHGYGSSNARLDRFQGIEDYLNHQTVSSLHLALGDAVTFGNSQHTFRRMTELWNGRVVYQRHWNAFLDDMRREWMQMTYFPLAIWMACIILVASGKACAAVFVSAWLSAAAVLVSLHLLQAHATDKLSTAPGISAWISRVEDLKHGLRPLSIKFALPRALTIYAFISLQLGLVLVYRATS
ncbi:hypothetical protein M407DRAFT_20352 [Tulasnella calospora MUT 4182]|uniref:WW domain-containing protein n=1 Tax=Tulasnella calospora MUT 4182 TaxID=1051891 RepID=A0A0C3QQ97_9AGAM|nr:hypothetical protein M407DRAFT_20352 [Tulasnella calospora MUT 4182]